MTHTLPAGSWLPLVVVAAVAAAGCGTSSPRTAPDTSTPPTTSSAPATTAGLSTSPASTSSAVPTGAPTQQPVPAESNPPGDIPDNLAFVAYANRAGHYRFKHPEGWLQQVSGSDVTFTDKLNGVHLSIDSAAVPADPAAARADDVPALRRAQPAFELRSVATAAVPAGRGLLITYRRNSAPDPVTGRQYRDEVQRYELPGQGRRVVMELFGPVGADNVDAYRTMVRSLALS